MAALIVHLAETLHLAAQRYAAQEGISVNQLISTALAEKLSALATEDHLAERANRASRDRFDTALASVPAVEPDAHDAP